MFLADSYSGFYWILLTGACLTVVAVSSARQYLQRTFSQFGGVRANCGLTGALAARQLLAAIGLNPVTVVRSDWIDCYDPRKRQVQLRDQTFDATNLAALATAAHEVGHAQQFASGFWPARLRLWMRPIYFGLVLAMLSVFFFGFTFLPMSRVSLVVLGISFVALLVQIPTVLPLEYDASRRAKALVLKEGLLAPYEESSFDRLLNAAGRTYLARECQRWLALLAGGAAIIWLAPVWSADPSEFAMVPQTTLTTPSDWPPELPDWESESSIDLMYPLLSSLVTLIPAGLLVVVLGRFAKPWKKRPTKIETAVARNNAGLDLLRRGELLAAAEAFSSALTLDPKLHTVYFNRGHCYVRQGQLDRAMADVEESLRLNPYFVDALALRGQIWTQLAKYDLARGDLDKVLQMAPRNSVALTYRGNLFLAQGDHDRALADFEQAIVNAPQDGAAYLGRATIALARRNIDVALADCSQAIASGADTDSAYCMRGLIWLQKHDCDRAIADFTASLKSGRESAVLLSNRGLAHYLKGDHAHAIPDLDKAIELDPKEAVAYNNRGAAYLKLGNFAAALTDLQKAIDLKPGFPNPHKHIAWLQATCPLPEFREGASAVAHAQLAHEVANETPAEYQALLAAAYAEAGDFSQAVECQSRCLELSPPQVLTSMRERLSLYQSGQPFRDTL